MSTLVRYPSAAYRSCANPVAEPAQAQVAMNGIAYALLRLLVNRSIEGNALLSFTYELIEMASDQGTFLPATALEKRRRVTN